MSSHSGADPYPQKVNVPKSSLVKFSRGEGLNLDPSEDTIKTSIRREKIQRRDEKLNVGLELAARTESLLLEEPGRIEVEEGESTLQYKQSDIKKKVDIASETKCFQLSLTNFGPYTFDYTRNGRFLVLGGRRGHIAAFDWVSKKLLCEFNSREDVSAVKWLHNESFFASAGERGLSVYDSQGIEVHNIKRSVQMLEYLPYHFLLVAGERNGHITWIDSSIGKIASHVASKRRDISAMSQNPNNATIQTGHLNGTVSMWVPSNPKPVTSMICHTSPVSAIAVDEVGRLMATGSRDGTVRIWDLRNSYASLGAAIVGAPNSLSFSQKNFLAVCVANEVQIFSDFGRKKQPYLKHVSNYTLFASQFCPFEDVLGIGSYGGFESILVPGSAEPNFDALEKNPYETKSQRREGEVKALLEKIPSDLISLDNSRLGDLDTSTLSEDIRAKPEYVKKKEIKLTHRLKRKTAKIPKIKRTVQWEANLRLARQEAQQEKQQGKGMESSSTIQAKKRSRMLSSSTSSFSGDPLDRFVRKNKKKNTNFSTERSGSPN